VSTVERGVVEHGHAEYLVRNGVIVEYWIDAVQVEGQVCALHMQPD
jgi:hypothetical protein